MQNLGISTYVLSCIVMSSGYSLDESESAYDESAYGYGVIIDAGSSGSKLMIYKWRKPWTFDRFNIPDIELVYSNKVKPGVSSLVDDSEDLKDHIVELVEEAKTQVEEDKHGDTLLAFMATAGMRLLLESRADDIMNDVRNILDDVTINPFRHSHRTTRILSGEEEGVFQWITVNYLNGYFKNPDTTQSVGVLELGGASTQITFTPDVAVLANKFPVTIGGRHYELYSHSYLNYGQDTITRWHESDLVWAFPQDDVIEDPCMLREDSKDLEMKGRPVVTLKGTGDPFKCSQYLTTYIYQVDPELCSPKPCSIGPFYQPSVPDDLDLYATGAYYVNVDALGLLNDQGNTVSPAQLHMAAQKYCRKDYHTALAETGQSPEFVSSPCLMGLYIYQLLTAAYHVPENTRHLHIVNDINNKPISWTLGALIYEVEQYSITLPENLCFNTVNSSQKLTPSFSLFTLLYCLSAL